MSRVQAVAQLAAPIVPVPVVWTLLGYQFEAGSMIAALCACFAVRYYASATSGTHRWSIDVPVSAIAMLFTVGIVIRLRPDVFFGLVYGTGIGAMGATIITASMAWVKKTTDVFSPAADKPPPDPAHGSTARQWAGEVQPTPPDMAQQLKRLDETKP